MSILSGKKLAKKLKKEIKIKVEKLIQTKGITPALDVIIVGSDPASEIYVRNKNKACKKTGIISHIHELPEDCSYRNLENLIKKLNANKDVSGIIVQLPLPAHINSTEIIPLISPEKDVDGFHPVNMGNLLTGRQSLMPCTPSACMKLIDETGIDLTGKKAVVVGRSQIVGKPLALMLLSRNATVTMCHSRTSNLAQEVKNADVLIAAVGVPELIKGSWIKQGAIVIDVGMNRLSDGTLSGDVEFEPAARRAEWITPVPGGVGPMTVACLINNTYLAASKNITSNPDKS